MHKADDWDQLYIGFEMLHIHDFIDLGWRRDIILHSKMSVCTCFVSFACVLVYWARFKLLFSYLTTIDFKPPTLWIKQKLILKPKLFDSS